MRPRLRDCIKHKFPEGWVPSVGQCIIVPCLNSKKACTAVVEGVFGDIVRVRVPVFQYGRQEWLLKDVRPHPYL